MTLISYVKKVRYVQYLATLTATLSITSAAVHSAWPSPTLPKLTSEDSPIGTTLTKDEASWVASFILLGGCFGSIVAWWILSKIGRKTTLLMSAIPVLFPWIAIFFAKSALTLYIARFISGIGQGMIFETAPIYIAEIAEKDIRGKLGSIQSVLGIAGSLFVLTVGPFVSYKTLVVTSSIFPLIFVVTFWHMPESPYYLIKNNRREEARINLISLSAQGADSKVVQEHLDEIDKTIEYDMRNRSTLVELLTKAEYRQSLIIMTGLKIIQHFTGTSAIEVYLQTIMVESHSSITPKTSSIIFGVIQIPSVLVTALIVDKVGRKPLLIISLLGCFVGLATEGCYFYIQETHPSLTRGISWLPLSALVLVVVMKVIGVGTLPYIIMSEIFPTNVKDLAISLFLTLGAVLGFLIIKYFESISSVWGMYTMFWIYSISCILGIIFIYVVLPETKGHTFMEIQEKLNKRRTFNS